MTSDAQVAEFLQIFQGNSRAVGVQIKNGGHRVDKEFINFTARAKEHFAGGNGLGIIPVRDSGTCIFGAIDIDNHGPGTDNQALDIKKLAEAVTNKRLPLVLCQSKSGGIHAYLFTSEPVPAYQMTEILHRWSQELKPVLPSAVFDAAYPKQADLKPSPDGTPRYGNFINLPYYNNDNSPSRLAHGVNGPISLEEFINLVKLVRVTPDWIKLALYGDISHMPPCLQTKMVTGGFQAGERNDGMYQVGVYVKKRAAQTGSTDKLIDELSDLAKKLCVANPISERELKTIAKSLEGREYRYKCSLPMFKSVCDSQTCKGMPCGISPEDSANIPMFGELIQYINVDPPVYDLPITIGETTHNIKKIPHRVLMYYGELKIWVAKQRIMIPPMKPADWDAVLTSLLNNAKLDELPDEVTPAGLLREAIYAFCSLADLSDRSDFHPLEILTRGMPAVGMVLGVRVVMFRAADFSKFLLKTKTQIPGGLADHWYISAGQIGVNRYQIGAGRNKTTVWYVPVEVLPEATESKKEFKSDF